MIILSVKFICVHWLSYFPPPPVKLCWLHCQLSCLGLTSCVQGISAARVQVAVQLPHIEACLLDIEYKAILAILGGNFSEAVDLPPDISRFHAQHRQTAATGRLVLLSQMTFNIQRDMLAPIHQHQ